MALKAPHNHNSSGGELLPVLGSSDLHDVLQRGDTRDERYAIALALHTGHMDDFCHSMENYRKHHAGQLAFPADSVPCGSCALYRE
ncbi:MAG: hypothetical protein KC680_01290 [Candidatus Peregrinibacteria bacterium]|nr:hypothetical protein [Candidatus Peregrinibacteria bacterium]MCB9808233.1 hypothetical protein [Candidatus Peribacteria bacterium]